MPTPFPSLMMNIRDEHVWEGLRIVLGFTDPDPEVSVDRCRTQI